MFNFKYKQKGQTLLELVVVMGVSVLILGALVFATISSLRNAQFSKNQTQATKLAQERIERIRVARDRNARISIIGSSVQSWDGSINSSTCLGNPLIKEDSVWCYRLSAICDRPGAGNTCYFKIAEPSEDPLESLMLTNINQVTTLPFPQDLAEKIPPSEPRFYIVITLSDDLNDNDYQKAKKVTAIVRWTDFAGPHESRLTTILRRL